jgi:hypothetical protein
VPTIACVILGTLVTCTTAAPAERPDPVTAAAQLQASVPAWQPHPDLRNSWGEQVYLGGTPAVAMGAPVPEPAPLQRQPSPNDIPLYLRAHPWVAPSPWAYQAGYVGLPYLTPPTYVTTDCPPPQRVRRAASPQPPLVVRAATTPGVGGGEKYGISGRR